MSEYRTIATATEGVVRRITLNRPDKRNPIGPLTCGELRHAIEEAAREQSVRVIVLTGAGTVFSAGGDLGAFAGNGSPANGVEPGSFADLLKAMHACGVPIIAMVNGHALAGGLGLMVACDLVVAADTASFGTTEVRVGLWPMMITAELTRNIGRKATLELMLTGKRIGAAEAARIGLVNSVVAQVDLEKTTMELAAALANNSPQTMALGLKAFYETQDFEHGRALAYLEEQFARVLATPDAREGVAAFLAKRAPKWPSLED